MFEGAVHKRLPKPYEVLSKTNQIDLYQEVEKADRRLVFFAGAGISAAGNTGMPAAGTLLAYLLEGAAYRTDKPELSTDPKVQETLSRAAWNLGFEITLNDFWQIHRDAIKGIFDTLAFGEDAVCKPNRAHKYLRYWLSLGGTVVTTNYDRLIEKAFANLGKPFVRFSESSGTHSFETWKSDLNKGGCLFKLHGTLAYAQSCLRALEHVGTRLTDRT